MCKYTYRCKFGHVNASTYVSNYSRMFNSKLFALVWLLTSVNVEQILFELVSILPWTSPILNGRKRTVNRFSVNIWFSLKYCVDFFHKCNIHIQNICIKVRNRIIRKKELIFSNKICNRWQKYSCYRVLQCLTLIYTHDNITESWILQIIWHIYKNIFFQIEHKTNTPKL